MTMSKHLNVLLTSDLLNTLDAFAAQRGINRSGAARLAIEHLVDGPQVYEAPTLPGWQGEAWTALLRGLFGERRLVLTDNIKGLLRQALAALDERSAQVLRLRFGLDGPRYTLAEVGAISGVNRQRAYQVEVAALRRMRGWLRARGIWELVGPQLEKEE